MDGISLGIELSLTGKQSGSTDGGFIYEDGDNFIFEDNNNFIFEDQ